MKMHQHLQYQLWLFWQNLSLLKFGKSILSVFGALWLIVEILAFFNKTEFSDDLKSLWWVFLILGLFFIVYRNWPKSFFTEKVQNRDVSVSIKIGDIFNIEGALIVPINDRLDCDNNGIVEKSNSILKYFINKVYNKTHSHLQTDINQHIEDQEDWYKSFEISQNPIKYKIGTVVPLFRDEKQYYLLCSSTLNQHGKSKTTKDDLRNSLNELWAFLTHSGSKDNLIIPIVGTGRGRITLTREEVIKEIVLSFLVSLSSDSYCEQLTICIHPGDLKKYNVNLDGILDFIRLHCNNTNYISRDVPPTGTGIG